MDLETIRRKALAARSFTKEVGGVTFTLCLPTQHESSTLYMRASAQEGSLAGAALVRWQRAMLAQAITGWSGAFLRHVLSDLVGDEGSEPFLFEPGAVEMLLDANPDWEEALTAELLERRSKRQAVEDAAAKN